MNQLVFIFLMIASIQIHNTKETIHHQLQFEKESRCLQLNNEPKALDIIEHVRVFDQVLVNVVPIAKKLWSYAIDRV